MLNLITSFDTFYMQKPFKYRKELANELGISTKTLKRRMDAMGIVCGKSALPFDLWQRVLHQLQTDEPAQINSDTQNKKVRDGGLSDIV